MRGLNLGLSPAVHNPKPCHGAPIIVSVANMTAEAGLADLSIEKDLLNPSRLLRRRCFEQIQRLLVEVTRIELRTDCVGGRERLIKTGARNCRKISLGNTADRLALQIGSDPTWIANFALSRLAVDALVDKWYRPIERL